MKKITQVDINTGEQELLNVSQSIIDRWLSEGPFFQKLPEIISEKQRKYDLYMDALKGVGDLEFLKREEHSNIVPFRFSVKTQYKEALEAHLEAHNVQAKSFFYPMHMHPVLQVYTRGKLPVAEALYNVGLCLPIHFNITDEDIAYISDCIVKFFEAK